MTETVRVVAGGDEQLGGGVVADTVHREEWTGELVEDGFAVSLQ